MKKSSCKKNPTNYLNLTKLFFISLVLVIFNINLQSINAQTFNIYQIDTTEYPKVKAFYTIKDEFYQNYTGVTKNDFKVQQNGIDVNFDLKCDLLDNSPAISLALLLDASTSMSQSVSPTEVRHQWATYGANVFVDSLKFTPGTAFSLITFGGVIDKSTNWVETQQLAKDDLKKYNPGVGGATNLSRPFYENAIGALDKLIARPKTSKRVAVMLTDGGHEAGQKFLRDEIIKKAQDNSIEIYIILLNANSAGGELEALAYETGGKLFRPNSKEDLNKAFFDIYRDLQNVFTCRLEWVEPYICQDDNPNREVVVTFTRPNPDLVSTTNYLVPTKGISKFEVSESELYFSDLNGGQISKDISLTAAVGNFKLTNYSITPNNGSFNIDWKGKSPLDVGGLVITQGNSKTITINYVEKNSLVELSHVLNFVDENCELPEVNLIAPCGGITKDVSYTNLPQLSQDLILKDIYYNNSNRDVVVNVSILNDINNEVTLKNGNNYNLKPNEYLSLDITFNPKSKDAKNIDFQFSTENGCSKPIGKFIATIGSVNILATPYDFGKVRVKTPKDGFITIENKSTFNVTLNDIEINTNNYFILDDIKTTPLTLAPNSTKNINIKYLSNIEKSIVETVKIKGIIVEQGNEAITLETQIKAISFLPNLTTVNKITFPNTDIGVATNPIILNLKNNSLFGDLNIKEIKYKNKTNSDFKFVGNPNLSNFDILSENELNFNLIFNPSKNGLQSDTLEILADNVEGPEPVEYIITEVVLEGNTNTIDDLQFVNISFGNTFLCANPQKSVTIDNRNGTGKITFTAVKKNNSSDFEIILPNNLEVLNGTESLFEIIYTPQNPGKHTEIIEVNFSDGRKGSFSIDGESTTIPFKSTFKNKNELLTPGNLSNITFISNLDSDNYGEISTIIYTLKFDPTFFRADANPFTTDLTDSKWAWTVDKSNQNNGVIIMTGKSTNGALLEKPKTIKNSLNLLTYLSDKTETFITVDTQIDNNCIENETDTTFIRYEGCLIDSRVITISDNKFFVKDLSPNVISMNQELNYGLGFDCEVYIKVFDVMGNLINDFGKQVQKQGEHKVLLPIENIPNGMYFIQVYAGPYSKNLKFIVNK